MSSSNTTLSDGRPDSAWLARYSLGVGRICQVAQAMAAVLVLIDLVLIGAAVVLRYVFSSPIVWGDEIVALSLTAIVMLTAPEVLRRNGHIGVDILTSMLPRSVAPWFNIWSCVAVLSMAGLLIMNGWRTAMLSRMIGRVTEGHLELPVWMLQLFLPLGGVLLAAVTLELIWRNGEQLLTSRHDRGAAL